MIWNVFKYENLFEIFASGIVFTVEANILTSELEDRMFHNFAVHDESFQKYVNYDICDCEPDKGIKVLMELIDGGKPVILITDARRLPFYKDYCSLDYVGKIPQVFEDLHSIVVIGYDSE